MKNKKEKSPKIHFFLLLVHTLPPCHDCSCIWFNYLYLPPKRLQPSEVYPDCSILKLSCIEANHGLCQSWSMPWIEGWAKCCCLISEQNWRWPIDIDPTSATNCAAHHLVTGETFYLTGQMISVSFYWDLNTIVWYREEFPWADLLQTFWYFKGSLSSLWGPSALLPHNGVPHNGPSGIRLSQCDAYWWQLSSADSKWWLFLHS